MNETEHNMLSKTQQEFYSKRIGKIYGTWEVIEVSFNTENKRQLWTLKCISCGKVKTVYFKNFKKTAMWCECKRESKPKEVKPKKIYNNDESYIGRVYGTEKVIGFQKKSNSYEWICECQKF